MSSYEKYYGIAIFYSLKSINTFCVVNSLVYTLTSSVYYVETYNIAFIKRLFSL